MKRTILTTVGAFVAVMVALGVFLAGSASAQTPPAGPKQPNPPAAGSPVKLAGKVASVSGNKLVLTTKGGDITVNIGANTFIVVDKNGKSAEGVAADIVTGKPAMVVGVATADPKVVDARMITQGKAMAGPHKGPGMGNNKHKGAVVEHMAAGTITAINGTTISLQGVKVANVQVQTGADTLVINNGFQSVGTLKVGDKVAIFGKPVKQDGTGGAAPAPKERTINAWAIRVENSSTVLRLAHVDAVNGNTVTARNREHKDGVTITSDAATSFKAIQVSQADKKVTIVNATQSDVKVGSNLMLEGVVSADGKNITAKAVLILPAKP